MKLRVSPVISFLERYINVLSFVFCRNDEKSLRENKCAKKKDAERSDISNGETFNAMLHDCVYLLLRKAAIIKLNSGRMSSCIIDAIYIQEQV